VQALYSSATSGRVHRTSAGARVLTQRRLCAMDLVQRLARSLEALERRARRTSRPFPSDEEQHRCTEQGDAAEEEQQSGE